MTKKNLGYILISFLSLVEFACTGGLNEAQILKDSKDSSKKSLAELQALIEAEPNNAAHYFKRANYYFDKKEFEPAYADAIKTLQLDSTKAEHFILMSDLYFVSTKTGQSKKLLERALTIDPKNNLALMKLAELYLYVKEYNKSIEQLDNVLRENKYNAKAYFLKGMNFKEMGDTTRAISSFATTVEQDPEYYNAYMQLGNLSSIKNNRNAIDYYNSALNINPRSTEALYGKALFYQLNGAFSQAKDTYGMLLQIDPQYRNAHYNLGFIASEITEDYDKGIAHYSDAIKIDAEYYQAYYMRGFCYERKGDKKNAELEYIAALQLKRDYDKAIEAVARIKNVR